MQRGLRGFRRSAGPCSNFGGLGGLLQRAQPPDLCEFFEALGFEMLRLFGTAGYRRPQTARFEHDFSSFKWLEGSFEVSLLCLTINSDEHEHVYLLKWSWLESFERDGFRRSSLQVCPLTLTSHLPPGSCKKLQNARAMQCPLTLLRLVGEDHAACLNH